ncbi:MAG: serine hydrolase [Sphingomonas sp.]|nr:serine hydrolase [Sphingomonas sp.]
MKNFVSVMCAAAATSIICGCQTVSPSAPAPPLEVAAPASYFPSDAELTELLQTLAEEGEAKGIVLGLLEPDGRRRVIVHGYAGTGARPLSAETVFEIGSINKTFTGAVLADMVRRGEVALEDPVSKYLPAGVSVPSRGREITLADLATHTSGLPRVPTGYKPPDMANPYANYQARDLYGFLSSYTLERDVGAEPVYSNLGAGLLGHVLARAAGVETIGELIRDRITDPLNMGMTDYGRAGELGAWLAKGHAEDGKPTPYWDVAVLAGAGGLNSNVNDMLTYLEANVADPQTPLRAAMRDAHHPRRSLKTEGFSIGLGWQQRTRGRQRIVHHGGSTGGFATYLGFDPITRAGVVILGNSGGFDSRDAVVFQLLKGSKFVTLPPSALREFVGTYQLRSDLLLTVSIEGEKLFGRIGKQRKARMHAIGSDKFLLLTSDVQLRFARDANGHSTWATLTKGTNALTGSKVAAPN